MGATLPMTLLAPPLCYPCCMEEAPKAIYAHSVAGRPRESWERLQPHLNGVAAAAAEFAQVFGARELGFAAGLLHDAGKLRHAFQRYLRGEVPSAEHSICGAVMAVDRYPAVIGRMLAYAIAGHHGGLPDGGVGSGGLDLRLSEARALMADMAPWPDDLAWPAAPTLGVKCSQAELPFAAAFRTRMLFSALVDADFLQTERFYEPAQAAARQAVAAIAIDALARRLDRHLERLAVGNKASGDVRARRAAVLARCRQAAEAGPGVFSLTVPTGGGKTLSSLAFALRHALRNGLRRVVYVIPYTSIIEQTADAFRSAFGDLAAAVVEHHSAASVPESEDVMGPRRLRLATENWDAPIIVTTSVQFFESLYANRPSRCRKLHNMAGSVVVLDEVQSLPVRLLNPCLAALRELTERCGSTVVLCSATVPDLRRSPALSGGFRHVTEIVDDVPGLFAAFKRVRIESAGRLDDPTLAERLASEHQVLCIVDSRPHAAELHGMVGDAAAGDTLHLSAAMCPAHRRRVLAEVKDRLENGLPCRLIATTVVEAGVDVDFPVVYRAVAGIDSLAQAAGRCNRNGRLPQPGRFVIFDDGRKLWLQDLERRRALVRPLLERAPDPLSLEAVTEWFATLFGVEASRLDELRILDRTAERSRQLTWPFRSIWEGDERFPPFRMIDQEATPVIVPWNGIAEPLLAELEGCLRAGRPVPLRMMRELQQVSVSVYPGQLAALRRRGAIGSAGPEGRFLVLTGAELYDQHVGLVSRDGERRPEDNIM